MDEFVSACWQTWARRVPFGIYNITNPGTANAREIVEIIKRELRVAKEFKFFDDEDEFYRAPGRAPRSNCVLDSSKLMATGIKLTNVTDAISAALRKWQPKSDQAY